MRVGINRGKGRGGRPFRKSIFQREEGIVEKGLLVIELLNNCLLLVYQSILCIKPIISSYLLRIS